MTIVGSDIPQGQQVRWYAGGVVTEESITVLSADVSAGYIDLAKNAEYGSLLIEISGTLTACTEFQASGTTPATETSGTGAFTYTGIAADDVVTAYYLDIDTTALTQVATALDIKTGITADTKTAAIHGQVNKLKTVGAIDQTAELEQFQYTQTFLATILGTQVAGTPAAGMNKLTTKQQGVKKIGCLVGKLYDTSYSTVKYKWFLIGAQATGIDKEFPAEDFYKDSMKFMIDEYLEVDLVA